MTRSIATSIKAAMALGLLGALSACSFALDGNGSSAQVAQQPYGPSYDGTQVTTESMIVASRPLPGAITMPLAPPSVGAAFSADMNDSWSVAAKPAVQGVVMPLAPPSVAGAFDSATSSSSIMDMARPVPGAVAMPIGAPSVASGFDARFSSEGAFEVAAMPTPAVDGLPLPPPAAYSAFGAESGLILDTRSGYARETAKTTPTQPARAGGLKLAFVGESDGAAGEMERKFRAMTLNNLDKYGFVSGRAGGKADHTLYCKFTRRGDPNTTSPATVRWVLRDSHGRKVDELRQELKLFPGIYDLKLVPAISGLTEEALHRFAATLNAHAG